MSSVDVRRRRVRVGDGAQCEQRLSSRNLVQPVTDDASWGRMVFDVLIGQDGHQSLLAALVTRADLALAKKGAVAKCQLVAVAGFAPSRSMLESGLVHNHFAVRVGQEEAELGLANLPDAELANTGAVLRLALSSA